MYNKFSPYGSSKLIKILLIWLIHSPKVYTTYYIFEDKIVLIDFDKERMTMIRFLGVKDDDQKQDWINLNEALKEILKELNRIVDASPGKASKKRKILTMKLIGLITVYWKGPR